MIYYYKTSDEALTALANTHNFANIAEVIQGIKEFIGRRREALFESQLRHDERAVEDARRDVYEVSEAMREYCINNIYI